MDIDEFIELIWNNHRLKPSGANGPRNGSKYEHEIANRLSHLNARVDGGSGHGNDIEFLLPPHPICSLEVKHNSFEFGGKTFKLKDGKLELPDDSIIKKYISYDFLKNFFHKQRLLSKLERTFKRKVEVDGIKMIKMHQLIFKK